MSIPNILADALGTFNDPPIVEKPNGGDALRTSSGRAAFYDQLAKMSPAEYARGRDAWAKSLGIPPTALNAEIKTRQKVRAAAFAKAAKAARVAQHALAHWSVQPWPDAVATDALLDALVEAFARYLILPRHAVEGVALWTLHAWTFGAGDISPFLALTSPTKRCGKTSLLILLYWLTPKSELAANISATAIFRYIDFERPTLLIDEADSFLEGNEEMRGVLNSGHTKAAAYVIRNVEIDGEHRPQRFSTWAPKAIATIGNLPGTLEDRSIIVRMQRKPKGAKVSRCRRHDCQEFANLRRQALRWATDNLESLRLATPALPEALNDRAADNWEPLLAIAELAGDEWTQRARVAALALSGDEAAGEDDLGVELLKDICAAFDASGRDATFTKTLIGWLVADEGRPWAAYGRAGKPIADRQIGKLLRPFGILSATLRIGGAKAKRYRISDLAEARSAYFSPSQAWQRGNADGMGISAGFSSVAKESCHGYEKSQKPNNDGHCHAATDKTPKTGVGVTFDDNEDDRSPAISAGPGDSLDDLDPGYRR